MKEKSKFIGWKKFRAHKTFYLFWIPIYSKTPLKNILDAIIELREQLELMKHVDLPALMHHPSVFPKYKGIHRGQDIVLVGAGPTLNKYSPIPGAVHIGVNRTYMARHVQLDYLFAADGGSLESEDLLNYRKNECVKFFGHHWDYPIKETFAADCKAERFYIGGNQLRSPYSFIPKDLAHQPIAFCCSVIIAAFQFALWCQPRRIYIVGCDAANNGYFTNSKNMPEQWLNNDIVKEWQLLAEFAQKHYPDIEIISINPVGLKGMFTDATMADGKLELLSPGQ